MENLSFIQCIALILLIIICHSILIVIIGIKRKGLSDDYEKLLNLKNWYEKMSDEANRSYIIESVEKRGQELISQLNLLNANLIEIQKEHKNLQEKQQYLHNSLIEEQKLLNQYFENYS